MSKNFLNFLALVLPAVIRFAATRLRRTQSGRLEGISKIVDKCPEGITTTAIAADPVMIVTENGAFDPRGLSFTERVVGIAHLAAPEACAKLLQHIYDSPEFHNPRVALREGHPAGFTPYQVL